MKEKYIVGKKPTRLKLIITILVSALLSLLFSNFLTSMLKDDSLFIPIFIVILLIIILLYVPTVAVCCSYWSVDMEHLEYYNIHKYMDELRYAVDILFGRNNQYAIQLSVKNIKKIDIYWTSQRYIWSTIAHPLMLGIEMKDGAVITFEGLFVNSNDFVSAIQFMKKEHQIHVLDPYKLLDILQNPQANLNEYIEQLRNGDKGVEQDV